MSIGQMFTDYMMERTPATTIIPTATAPKKLRVFQATSAVGNAAQKKILLLGDGDFEEIAQFHSWFDGIQDVVLNFDGGLAGIKGLFGHGADGKHPGFVKVVAVQNGRKVNHNRFIGRKLLTPGPAGKSDGGPLSAGR